jgi:beta-adrenergic-receptor kinase
MHKHLQKMSEHTFDKIFNQQLGFLLFKDFCNSSCEEPVPQLKFYEEVSAKEKKNDWIEKTGKKHFF